LIATPNGSHVPLEQVTNFKLGEGSLNISRESACA